MPVEKGEEGLVEAAVQALRNPKPKNEQSVQEHIDDYLTTEEYLGDGVFRRTQDVTALHDKMKAVNNSGRAGWSDSRDFKLEAEWPNEMLNKWGAEDGFVNFLAMPVKQFKEWATRHTHKDGCEDFLVRRQSESFRLSLGGVMVPEPKPKRLYVVTEPK